MLHKIADSEFKPLKPLLDALRSGDLRRIAKYEDMMPSEMWERLRQQIDSFAVSAALPTPEASASNDDWSRALVALMALGFAQPEVEAALRQAKAGGAKTLHVMVRQAMIQLQGETGCAEDDPQDLRRLADKVEG